MSLRDEQRELTRTKVLDAVLELVADGSLDELSVPAVARRCGVSVATIYRHYPTRDELLAAAAAEPSRRAVEQASASSARHSGDDDLAAYQRALWTDFARNLPLLRHQIASTAGRQMRQARLERSREMLGRYLHSVGVDPETPEGSRLTALILLISGSLGLVELHDRQGLPVDAAIDAALWAVRALIEATRNEAS